MFLKGRYFVKRLLIAFVSSLVITSVSAQSERSSETMQPIVFVHGAWGGGWDYKLLQSMLEERGREVYRLTLTGLGERVHLISPEINLDTHIMDVVNVLKFEDLSNVVLVGHSYGGMVVTGVAHRVPELIGHLVYVDAMLPVDGESVFSLMEEERSRMMMSLADSQGEGFKIPPFWPDPGKDVPHPVGTFRQEISLGNPAADKIPATYVLTIEKGASQDQFSVYARRAKERGWNYVEWNTGHNPQRTMPNEYVAMLMGIK